MTEIRRGQCGLVKDVEAVDERQHRVSVEQGGRDRQEETGGAERAGLEEGIHTIGKKTKKLLMVCQIHCGK